MRLTDPTDFEILDALSDGRRNTAANLAHLIDRTRPYINTRLPLLADYGLVERVGPAPNSGLYQITPRGLAALELRDQYGEVDDFDDRVARRASETPAEN
jgi:hypothetical protein